uniref:Uncharacterized protein n=1 Tax=Aegilops tauschii subsp. strangulata TaxID=200361 RepID=A0A453SH35_AEGTS
PMPRPVIYCSSVNTSPIPKVTSRRQSTHARQGRLLGAFSSARINNWPTYHCPISFAKKKERDRGACLQLDPTMRRAAALYSSPLSSG